MTAELLVRRLRVHAVPGAARPTRSRSVAPDDARRLSAATMIAPNAIAAAQLPEGWIAERRELIVRDGYATRAGENACTIEIKSLTTNEWLLLMLPGGALSFTTAEDRDAVLRQLWEGVQ